MHEKSINTILIVGKMELKLKEFNCMKNQNEKYKSHDS